MNLKILKVFIMLGFFLSVTNVLGVYAGWFSPSPPELMIDEQVEVKQGGVVRIPVIFDERANYRISFSMSERVDFHSEEGKKIQWGEKLKFKAVLEDGSKTYVEQLIDEVLNYSQGYGLCTVKVPGDAPKNKQLYIKMVFIEVGSEYNSIYKSSKVSVEKLPYVRFLD